MSELLDLRKRIKKKKPTFKRQEFLRTKLGPKWRRPKGGQSKLRKGKKSHGHIPHPGYSSPRKVRGLSPSGLREIIISNLNQLNSLTKEDGIVISRKVGLKKKIELLNKIKEKKLTLLNLKDIDTYIKNAQEKLKLKKQAKEKRKERKEKTKKALEKEAKKAKEKEAQKTEEDKEKEQKEIKRKVLEGKTTKTSGGTS